MQYSLSFKSLTLEHFYSDRQQVEATLNEMVEALVEEFLQPTQNQLTPRPE